MYAPDRHTVKCNLTQIGPQYTQHLLTLFVIQGSAVPGLTHIIAMREKGLTCSVEEIRKYDTTV